MATSKQLLRETTSVESSNVDRVGWSEEEGLVVSFHSGDYVYTYSAAPRTLYESLMSADSVGSYFHRNVKGKFGFARHWQPPAWMEPFLMLIQLDESIEPGDQHDREVFIERVVGDWEHEFVSEEVYASITGQVDLLKELKRQSLLEQPS